MNRLAIEGITSFTTVPFVFASRDTARSLTGYIGPDDTVYVVAGLAPGLTFEQADADVDAFFEAGQWPSGDPSVTIVGGLGAVAPDQTAYFEVTMTPGSYTIVSSDSDGENEVHTEFQVT